MATYAVSLYGTGTYGPISPTEFATELVVRPLAYDRLLLTWNPPPGNWSDIRLVRSSYGFPMSATADSTILVDEAKATAPVSFLDTSLQPGRFYYYTMFVFSIGDARWTPAGTAMGLVTEDHGNLDLLWDKIPLVYKEADVEQDDLLHRFLNLFSYQLDRTHTEVETLRDVANIDRVSGVLLPTLAESLGVPYEPELGMRSTRGLVKNAVHLAKSKGTVPGVEGVASAYTDFGATAVVGKNLLLDKNSSGWVEPTVGTWEVVANAVLDTVDGVTLTPAVADTGSLRITADGNGDVTVVSGTFADSTLLPVEEGTTYVGSLSVQAAATARSGVLSLVYYDATGAQVGIFNDAAANDPIGSWTRQEISGLAPAGAVWAALQLVITAPVASEIHYVGAAQFEEGATATAWESGRTIHIYLEPQRANLTPNPSFEVDAAGWAALANATVARSTDESYGPVASTASLRITASAAGDASAHTPTPLPTTAGEPYTLTAYFRPGVAAVDRSVHVALAWTNGGTPVSTSTGTVAAEVTEDWVRARITATAPAGTDGVQLVATVEDAAIGEIHYLDAVLFEQTEFVKDYFDAGMFPPSDYLWAGTAHASASYSYPRRALKDERLLDVLPRHLPATVEFETHYGETAPASSV